MKSNDLIDQLPLSLLQGNLPAEITRLRDDHRQVEAGDGFIAVAGSSFDGHSVIDEAISAGAGFIIAQTEPSAAAKAAGIAWLQAPCTRDILGPLMSRLHGEPSKQLVLLGVTGTNGKTTISYLAQHIMRSAWQRVGLLGTIINDDGNRRVKSKNTTPGAAELQAILADMLEKGCRGVSMEVSSHALHQSRVAGCDFRVGIFTNLTQDHLDYHADMEEYYQCKKRLFTDMAASGNKKAIAIINIDDNYGRRLVEELHPIMKVRSFGLNPEADYCATPSIMSIKGSQFELSYQGKKFLVRTPLIGNFNISNSLAALAGASAVGIPLRDAIASLAQAPQVPGRLELVSSENNVQCFVDYAHTPDALENVLSTMKGLCRNGRLICVFGCGGDRDRGKRPLMGAAAAKYSELCVVTSDNPRSEDPESIIDDIMEGIPKEKQHRISDRGEAIRAVLELARGGDVILIAGKGHEDYQILAEETIHFSDASTVRHFYRLRNPDGMSVPSPRKPREGGDKK